MRGRRGLGWLGVVARWGATGIAVALLGAALVSLRWRVSVGHVGTAGRDVRIHSFAVSGGDGWLMRTITTRVGADPGTLPSAGFKVLVRPPSGAFGAPWWPPWGKWSMRGGEGIAVLSLWPWVIGFGVLSTGAWVVHRTRRKRRHNGICGCGYSLAGLPADAACPECGARGVGGGRGKRERGSVDNT